MRLTKRAVPWLLFAVLAILPGVAVAQTSTPSTHAGAADAQAASLRAHTDATSKRLEKLKEAIRNLGCVSQEKADEINTEIARLEGALSEAIALEALLDPAVHQAWEAQAHALRTPGAAAASAAYRKIFDAEAGRIRRRLAQTPVHATPCPQTGATSPPPGGPTEKTPAKPGKAVADEPKLTATPGGPVETTPPGTVKCPHCGTRQPKPAGGVGTCPNCGEAYGGDEGAAKPKVICPHCGLPEPKPDGVGTCPDCGEAYSGPAAKPQTTPAQREAATDNAGADLNAAMDAVLKDCTNQKLVEKYLEAVKAFNAAFEAEASGDRDVAVERALRDAMDQQRQADKSNADLSKEDQLASENATTKARRNFAKALGEAEARIRDRLKKLGLNLYERSPCPPPMTTPPPPPPPPPETTPKPCPPASGNSSLPPPQGHAMAALAPGAVKCPEPSQNSLGIRLPKKPKPGKEEDGNAQATKPAAGRDP